jgi:hypothetical protein
MAIENLDPLKNWRFDKKKFNRYIQIIKKIMEDLFFGLSYGLCRKSTQPI